MHSSKSAAIYTPAERSLAAGYMCFAGLPVPRSKLPDRGDERRETRSTVTARSSLIPETTRLCSLLHATLSRCGRTGSYSRALYLLCPYDATSIRAFFVCCATLSSSGDFCIVPSKFSSKGSHKFKLIWTSMHDDTQMLRIGLARDAATLLGLSTGHAHRPSHRRLCQYGCGKLRGERTANAAFLRPLAASLEWIRRHSRRARRIDADRLSTVDGTDRAQQSLG